MTPSTTPNTATWSHSRPLTRWIVDTVTPAGSRSAWNASRSQASNVAASGCRSATAISPSRSSRWLAPCPPPLRSSRLIADASPTASRTTSRTSRVVPAAPGFDDEAEVVGEVEHLVAILVGHLCGQRLDRRRRSTTGAARCARGTTAGRPRDGRRRISTTSPAANAVGIGGDAQVGEGGAQAGAAEHVGCDDGVEGDAGGTQGDVGRQQHAS